MNPADLTEVKRLLGANDFSFKKSLGQNFIVDDGICPAMAESCCGEEIGILEIGPGAGVLTVELARRARKVVALEVDERLRPILATTLADYPNVTVRFEDVMKADLPTLLQQEFADCSGINVCANLPYYITSPVLLMLLESHLPIGSVTAMVQKEAAERLCASVGSRAAGAVTVAVEYRAESEILFSVPRTCFLPQPKVDSAVIRLTLRQSPPVAVTDEDFFFRLSRSCFAQRRKTLLNAVSNTLGIDKAALAEALTALSLPLAVRGEELNLAQLAALANRLGEEN